MEGARDEQTHAIIGAAMAVHRELGRGFLEAVYQEALAVELSLRQIPFEREKPLSVAYKGRALATTYRADFVCYGAIIVECKAQSSLGNTETAQAMNYLKATGHERALLINFGTTSLQFKRIVLSQHRQERSAD